MDCRNLMRFWDGELPLDEVDAFQAHLLECRACLVELDALAQFDALALQQMSWTSANPPPGLRPRP